MDFTVILYRYPGTCVFDRHEKYQKYMYTYMSCTGRFGSNQTTIFRVMYGFVLLHVCTCTAVQLCSVVVNITLLVKAWKLETLKIVYYIIIYCTCRNLHVHVLFQGSFQFYTNSVYTILGYNSIIVYYICILYTWYIIYIIYIHYNTERYHMSIIIVYSYIYTYTRIYTPWLDYTSIYIVWNDSHT